MRRLPLLAAAAALLAAPAAAQSATPAENLDCAVWAAYQVGKAQDEGVKNGLSIAVAWFIGLYEGQTGKTIDKAMTARAGQLDEAGVEALTGPCIGRFSGFADRLGALGTEMSGGSN